MSIAKPTQEELREHYFLFSADASSSPRFPNVPPIQFSDNELDELLQPLRANAKHGHANETWLRSQLAEAGKWFPRDLYFFQRRPSPSETERQFKKIQNAANALLESLGVKSKSPRKLPAEIEAYLQMAAARYGGNVGLPDGVAPLAVHWDFWTACKLPSVVVGISLLERWSGMARAELRTSIVNRKNPKRRNAGDVAARVLIQRLFRFWWQWHGDIPGSGRGTFVPFVQKYLELMRGHLADEHRQHVEKIDAELRLTDDSVLAHLKGYKSQLAKKSKRATDKVKSALSQH